MTTAPGDSEIRFAEPGSGGCIIPKYGLPAAQGLALAQRFAKMPPLVNLAGFERLRIMGDEDCGVGVVCDDCPDGGRPVAYYVGIARYYDGDPAVTVVESITDLLAAGRKHLDEKHR